MITTSKFQLKHLTSFASLLLFALLAKPPAYATNVTIKVVDSAGAILQGATVYAMAEGTDSNGNPIPSATNTKMGVTDALGEVTLNLTSATEYTVFAASLGKGPTIMQQRPNPLFIQDPDNVSGTLTVTLDVTLTNRGTIIANVTNGTADSIMFGAAFKAGGGFPVGEGACQTDGTGACEMQFINVKAASADTYEVGLFDPQGNGGTGNGGGGTISSPLTAGESVAIAVDLSNGLPPDFSASEGDHGHGEDTGGRGDVSVEGVVVDAHSSTTTIPYGFVALTINENGNVFESAFSNVDENGRFTFFNLTVGTTYYVRTAGGCRSDGRCYDGYESTAAAQGTAPTSNDFLYVSSTTKLIHRVQLDEVTPGAGSLDIYVTDTQDQNIPGAWISLWSDGEPWHVNPSSPICDGQQFHGDQFQQVDVSSPGFANANTQATTGYVHLSGLRPGNYQLQVFSPFTQGGTIFNGGADGQFQFGMGHRGCYSGSEDDLRLTLEDNNSWTVYDTSGNISANRVALSSVTVQVPTSTGVGVVYGTVTFSSIPDLSANPITIVLRGTCGEGGCEGGGFATIKGNTSASYNYSIQVPTVTSGGSPASYFPDVISSYWGRVIAGGGEQQISFSNTQSIKRDMTFAPAGRVIGKLFKPDGSVFRPGDQPGGGFISAGIIAEGITVESWSYGEVQADGSYILGGLLPGEYVVRPEIHGGEVSYAPSEPPERVNVSANADSYKDIRFVNGEVLLVSMSTDTLPSLSNQYTDPSEKNLAGEVWKGIRFSAGTPLDVNTLPSILDGHLNESQSFEFVPADSFRCQGPNWIGGWCPQRVPTNSVYDLYMARVGDFSGQGGHSVRPYFTIVASSKGVIVDQTHRSGTPISAPGNSFDNVDPVRVAIDPGTVSDGVVITGTVTAQNFMREDNFQSLGGNFGNFLRFIPTVSVYDSSGNIVGAGMVVPDPTLLEGSVGDDIEDSIIDENFDNFKTAFSGLQFAYEIRGVPPSKTYDLVGFTPNYPPFRKQITVGADGTTKTVNIDWDNEVGEGSTITGVVQTTNSVVLPNASISVQARGIKEKIVTTDASGSYKAEGLGSGSYTLQARANGYALIQKRQSVVGNSTFTVNFSLDEAPGVIEGTVRELGYTAQGPVKKPVQDALVLAYDDTYNVNNTTAPLALYKVATSSAGTYSLTGLIPTHVYSLAVMSPGRYVKTSTITALNGTLTGQDFNLDQKPVDVDLTVCHDETNVTIQILNPFNFQDGTVYYSTAPIGGFESSVATDISNDFTSLPDGTLVGTIPLSDLVSGTNYTLHLEANPATDDPPVIKEVVFGTNIACVRQDGIDDRIYGNPTEGKDGIPANEVRLDQEGTDNSAIVIPPGALVNIGATDLPLMDLNAQDPVVAGISGSSITFTGKTYDISLTSVNFTSRPIEIIMGYDPTLVGSDLSSLTLYHLNPNTGEYDVVSGQATIDPVERTLSMLVDLSALPGFQRTANGAKGTMRTLTNGVQNLVNPHAMTTGSSSFVVGLAVSTGASNTANKYVQYNYPNPFDLKTKTVGFRSGTTGVASTITGTYIVLALPGSGTTTGAIRIYNVAGDMVREIQETMTLGTYNYIHWDGKNTSGREVASGVYFGVVDAPGSDKSKHLKMVVVK